MNKHTFPVVAGGPGKFRSAEQIDRSPRPSEQQAQVWPAAPRHSGQCKHTFQFMSAIEYIYLYLILFIKSFFYCST